MISPRSLFRLGILLIGASSLAGLVLASDSVITATDLVHDGASAFAYVIQVLTLTTFLVVVSMWLLHGPEAVSMLRRTLKRESGTDAAVPMQGETPAEVR